MNEKLSYTYEFIDPLFDLSSDLPEESNQCYGKDVAEKICHVLLHAGYNPEVIEEDWGWSVVYDHNDQGVVILGIYPWGFLGALTGNEEYLWRIRLTYETKKKLLGLFSTNKQVKVPAIITDDLKKILSQNVHKFIRIKEGMVWK